MIKNTPTVVIENHQHRARRRARRREQSTGIVQKGNIPHHAERRARMACRNPEYRRHQPVVSRVAKSKLLTGW